MQTSFTPSTPPAAWIDFTRRNDPASPVALNRFLLQLKTNGAPAVLCFWTKAPNTLAQIYQDTFGLRIFREARTLFLAQVTNNHYDARIEPGINDDRRPLAHLVELLGADAIRLRFDPIIPGYTQLDHFRQCVQDAVVYGIRRITINWYVSYKDTARVLAKRGIVVQEQTDDDKVAYAHELLSIAEPHGIELAVCAENAMLVTRLPALKVAACADMAWAAALRTELAGRFKKRPSRKGCGCCYTDDWGEYASRGASPCPHQCIYCYAK
jgi:hypothetical protein